MKQLLVERIRNLATTGRDRLSQNSKLLDSLAERIANGGDSKVVEFHTHVMSSPMCGRYYRRSDKQRIAEAFSVAKLPGAFILPDWNCNDMKHRVTYEAGCSCE